jgi:hypothetical protein
MNDESVNFCWRFQKLVSFILENNETLAVSVMDQDSLNPDLDTAF